MTKLYRLGCGCILPAQPSPAEEILIRPGRLTDHQADVVERFLAGEELDKDERRSLRCAIWRSEKPHEWWAGRGRKPRRRAESISTPIGSAKMRHMEDS